MLWPPLTATAVGHNQPRRHTGTDARARTNASLDPGVAARLLLATSKEAGKRALVDPPDDWH